MKKNTLLIPNLFLTLLICLSIVTFESCTPEEQLNSVNDVQAWFDKTHGAKWNAFPKMTPIESIEWSRAIRHGNTVEVPVALKEKVSGQYFNGNASNKNQISIRLVIWPEGDNYRAIVAEILQQGGALPKHLGEIEKSNFSGLIIGHYGDGKKYGALIENGISGQKNQFANTGRTEGSTCI